METHLEDRNLTWGQRMDVIAVNRKKSYTSSVFESLSDIFILSGKTSELSFEYYQSKQTNCVTTYHTKKMKKKKNVSVASSVFSDPSYRLDTKTGYLITNPRELIHQFATMTPVATIDDSVNNTPATHITQKQSYYKRTEETTE